jgi:hypothetical protein
MGYLDRFRSARIATGRLYYRFQFNKRAELFVGVHDEPLSVVAMRVSVVGLRKCA